MRVLAAIALCVVLADCSSRVRQPFVDVTIVNVDDAPPPPDKVQVDTPRTRVRVPREK